MRSEFWRVDARPAEFRPFILPSIGRAEARPGLMELAGAYWRQENPVGALLALEPLTSAWDPDFDATPYIPQEFRRPEFATAYARANTPEDVEAITRQIRRELRDRETMGQFGFWTNLGVGIGVAGLLDPTNLLPIAPAVDALKGARFLKRAVTTAKYGLPGLLAAEGLLYAAQETRTPSEVAFNLGAGTLMMGLLGGAVTGLQPREARAIEEAVKRDIDFYAGPKGEVYPAYKAGEKYPVALPASVTGGTAVEVLDRALALGYIDPGAHRLLRYFVTEVDPDFDGRALLEIWDAVKVAGREIKRLEGIPDEATAYIVGKTASQYTDQGLLRTAISLFRGHDGDTAVEEWYHYIYDQILTPAQRDTWAAYHRASGDTRAVHEHFAQFSRDFFFSNKLHEKVGPLRTLFRNAKQALLLLIQRIRGIRGARIPKEIEDLVRRGGMRREDYSEWRRESRRWWINLSEQERQQEARAETVVEPVVEPAVERTVETGAPAAAAEALPSEADYWAGQTWGYTRMIAEAADEQGWTEAIRAARAEGLGVAEIVQRLEINEDYVAAVLAREGDAGEDVSAAWWGWHDWLRAQPEGTKGVGYQVRRYPDAQEKDLKRKEIILFHGTTLQRLEEIAQSGYFHEGERVGPCLAARFDDAAQYPEFPAEEEIPVVVALQVQTSRLRPDPTDRNSDISLRESLFPDTSFGSSAIHEGSIPIEKIKGIYYAGDERQVLQEDLQEFPNLLSRGLGIKDEQVGGAEGVGYQVRRGEAKEEGEPGIQPTHRRGFEEVESALPPRETLAIIDAGGTPSGPVPDRGVLIVPQSDSPWNRVSYQLRAVERLVTPRYKREPEVRIFDVSAQPEVMAHFKDREPEHLIQSLDEARWANSNAQRVKDWQEIYAQAPVLKAWNKIFKYNPVAEGIADTAGDKVGGVPILGLTIGCQRAWAIVERVLNGLLPPETRLEACYGMLCWVNWQLGRLFGNTDLMEYTGFVSADPKYFNEWIRKHKELLESGPQLKGRLPILQHGQMGDDSHTIAMGLAKEWLKACAKNDLRAKNIFISSAYAPITRAQYEELLPYKDLFELHISVSGWFHLVEIMLRLAEFAEARDVGLPVHLRVITNKDLISGIEMPNEPFLDDMLKQLGVTQYEILETPFHDDRLRNRKNAQDRSEPSGKYFNICCEQKTCRGCGAKCLTKKPGKKDSALVDFQVDPKRIERVGHQVREYPAAYQVKVEDVHADAQSRLDPDMDDGSRVAPIRGVSPEKSERILRFVEQVHPGARVFFTKFSPLPGRIAEGLVVSWERLRKNLRGQGTEEAAEIIKRRELNRYLSRAERSIYTHFVNTLNQAAGRQPVADAGFTDVVRAKWNWRSLREFKRAVGLAMMDLENGRDIKKYAAGVQAAAREMSAIMLELGKRANKIGQITGANIEQGLAEGVTHFPRIWKHEYIRRYRPAARKILRDLLGPDVTSQQIDEALNSISGSPTGSMGYYDLSEAQDAAKIDTWKSKFFERRELQVDHSRLIGVQVKDARGNPLTIDLIETDALKAVERYLDSVMGSIVLGEKYGDVTMQKEFQQLWQHYDEILNAQGPEVDTSPILKERDAAFKDLLALRDMVNGTYARTHGWDPAGKAMRASKLLMNINAMLYLGGVVFSSLADVARPMFHWGLEYHLPALAEYVQVFRTPEFAQMRREMRDVWGAALSAFNHERLFAISDIAEDARGDTAVERGVRALADQMGLFTLMDLWNSSNKEIAGYVAVHATLDVAGKVRAAAERGVALTMDAMAGEVDRRFLVQIAQMGLGLEDLVGVARQVERFGEKYGPLTLTRTDRWDNLALRSKFESAMVKEIDQTILTPSVGDKPLWAHWGVLAHAYQFKSFGMAGMRGVIVQGLQDMDLRTLEGILASTAAGAGVYYLKALEAGRDPSDNPGEILLNAIDKGGLTAYLMDLDSMIHRVSQGTFGVQSWLTGEGAQRFAAKSTSDIVFGPTVGTLENMSRLGFRTIPHALTGNLVQGDETPILRLWPYSKAPYVRFLMERLREGARESLPTAAEREAAG